MAAPPKLTANRMRQAQTDKQAAYVALLREKGKAHVARFVTRMDGALQLAFEATRPATEVKQTFSPPPTVDMGVEEQDRAAWITEWKAVVADTYKTGGRNFTVTFGGTDVLVDVVLTWAP